MFGVLELFMGNKEDAEKWRQQRIAKATNHEICGKCGLPKDCSDFDCRLRHCRCGYLSVSKY